MKVRKKAVGTWAIDSISRNADHTPHGVGNKGMRTSIELSSLDSTVDVSFRQFTQDGFDATWLEPPLD
jgi:hypothetical protein